MNDGIWSLKQAMKGQWKPNQNTILRERYNTFKTIALNRFDWDTNENPIMDSKTIEELFYHNQYLGIWNSEQLGMPVITPIKMEMRTNFLNQPIPKEPILYGDSLKYMDEDIVWTYGDDVILTILLYCQKMMDIQTAKDQQIFNQRSPLFAVTTDKTKMTKDRFAIETIKEDIKILLIEEGIFENLKALDLKGQLNLQILDEAQTVYENRILTRLGIDTNQPKKERKIVDEQNFNDELIGCIMNDFLFRRRKLADYVGWKVNPIEIERVVENGENTQTDT